MTPKWLSYVNLSDAYERKARFLPAVLSLLPLVPASATLGGPLMEWLKLVLGGVGVGAVAAVGLSHCASALGNRLQKRVWPRWPLDSPTNRSLHPRDKHTSSQQRQLWYVAITRLTGIDIATVAATGGKGEIDATINDAVVALRNLFWNRPEAERLRMHNVDYGFARNLAGMFPVWGAFAVASAAVCWYQYLFSDGQAGLWAAVSTLVLLAAIPLGLWVLPAYVRAKATYYAESVLGTLSAIDREAGSGGGNASTRGVQH